MVVDSLLHHLNNQGLFTLGYADDLTILIRGKHAETVSELMQLALKLVEEWCDRENLKVNPNKSTLIPFTRKIKLEKLKAPTLFGKELYFEKEVKYLGVTLDHKLNWNTHVSNIVNKGKISFMATKRALGKTWGFNPQIVHWLYITVVRPMIAYGSLVWWPKTQQRTARIELTKLQRLACLCITNAMRSTPTASMEVMLELPPLDIYIKAEARIGSYRLKCNNAWRPTCMVGHTRIDNVISIPQLNMRGDSMTKKNKW